MKKVFIFEFMILTLLLISCEIHGEFEDRWLYNGRESDFYFMEVDSFNLVDKYTFEITVNYSFGWNNEHQVIEDNVDEYDVLIKYYDGNTNKATTLDTIRYNNYYSQQNFVNVTRNEEDRFKDLLFSNNYSFTFRSEFSLNQRNSEIYIEIMVNQVLIPSTFLIMPIFKINQVNEDVFLDCKYYYGLPVYTFHTLADFFNYRKPFDYPLVSPSKE